MRKKIICFALVTAIASISISGFCVSAKSLNGGYAWSDCYESYGQAVTGYSGSGSVYAYCEYSCYPYYGNTYHLHDSESDGGYAKSVYARCYSNGGLRAADVYGSHSVSNSNGTGSTTTSDSWSD